MRVFVLTTALALAACAGASGAGDQPPPFTAAAPQNAPVAATYPTAVDVPAGDYQLDQRHASVIVRIRHEGLAWFTARFDTKEASLDELGGCAFRSDMAALHHETQYSRLFRS